MANMHRVQRRMIRNFGNKRWINFIDKNKEDIRKIPNTSESLEHFCCGEDCYYPETDALLTIAENYYNNVVRRIGEIENWGQYKKPFYSAESVGNVFEVGTDEKMVWLMW